MTNVYILVFGSLVILAAVGGYCLGRYQASLIDKIRTLSEQQGRQEPAPEPVKPTVTGGAYQPPKEVSTTTENKQGAGLVETKTPQRLAWENDNELANLEHGG